MRSPAIALILLFALLSARAGNVTVLGDSLTKEYQVTFPGLPSLGVDGIDPANPAARNWIEILHQHRSAHFHLGQFRNTPFFDMWSDTRLLGHQFNWAIPGATSRALRLIITDPDNPEILEEPDLSTLLAFASDWRDVPLRLATQLTATSAAVIWLGGNDLRFGNTELSTSVGGQKIRYQTIYEGDGTGAGDPAPLMSSIRENIKALAQYVRAANPTLPIAIIAVPHIGCAPTVKNAWPTDPVRTGRITSALTALNTELKTWTENTLGGAWVDIYPLTLDLIGGSPDIGCIQFANAPNNNPASAPASAHNRFIFSHDGFHPTSTFQGRVAQMVQETLRARWPAAFADSLPLTDRELVTTVLGIPANTGFTEFMAASGAPAGQLGPLDDPDKDGLSNLVEFALGGNHPWSSGPPFAPLPGIEAAPVPAVTLTWSPACETNLYAGLICQHSANLTDWSEVPASQITANPGGTVTARVPITGTAPVFLRLRITAAP
jgi:lysophospholipase L1-like esterase